MESFQRLEVEWGKFAGYSQEQTVACSSGTAALHLAFEALQLPQGSEVVLSDFNMVACARAVTLAGLVPIFADCNRNLLLDPEQVKRWLPGGPEHNNRVRAILATHIYGRRVDMNSLYETAKKYDLYMIEDLAEAHGVPPHPNTDVACWSFYKNKIVAGEEGGAVCFKNASAAARARRLRSLGFGPEQDYKHIPRGHNYRLANSLASLVLDSLGSYRLWVKARRAVEEEYENYCPDAWKQPAREAPWVYDIRIPNLTPGQQNRIVTKLRGEGIEARHAFKPMSVQEEYREFGRVWGTGKEAERAAREVLYLPLLPLGIHPREDAYKTFDIIQSTLAES